MSGPSGLTTEQRFWVKVSKTDSCWMWGGAKGKRGYGHFVVKTPSGEWKNKMAHRYAYEISIGPIPEGMEVDHVCFTPGCVNPAHLRPLDPETNNRTQRSAVKTHCVNGHEFTADNTYIRPSKKGGGVRDCRACIRKRVAKYRSTI